jgi:hemolysin activation/secretion protein
LKVQDRLPVNGFVELNSKQSQNTEAGRLEASVSYDNLFQRQHSLGAYWFYAPRKPSEANIISTTYRAPFGAPGDQLFVLWTHADSDTATALGGATVARGDTFGLRWRDELRTTGAYQHGLTWGASYRSLRDKNRDVAGFITPESPLRYPSFNLGYDLVSAGPAPGRLTTFDAGLTVGFAGLGGRTIDCDGRQLDQFACKRAGASPGFQVATLAASHRRPIGAWSVFARVQAQFASGPLVPAEQITLGGIDTVRGYYEGEQAGDAALAGRFEIESPRFAPGAPGGRVGLKALVFIDRADLRKREALPGEPQRIHLGSYGLGLRLDSTFGLQARLDWAAVVFDTRRLDSAGAREPVSGEAAGRRHRWELSVRQVF